MRRGAWRLVLVAWLGMRVLLLMWTEREFHCSRRPRVTDEPPLNSGMPADGRQASIHLMEAAPVPAPDTGVPVPDTESTAGTSDASGATASAAPPRPELPFSARIPHGEQRGALSPPG